MRRRSQSQSNNEKKRNSVNEKCIPVWIASFFAAWSSGLQFAQPGWGRDYWTQPAADDAECGGALASIRGLTREQTWQLVEDLDCRMPADWIHSCSVPGLNDTEWNATTLAADHLRRPILAQLRHAVWRITRAIMARWRCEMVRRDKLRDLPFSNKTDFLELHSSTWRDLAQLLSLGVTLPSQLFVPLAFEVVGSHTNVKQLDGWMKNMERVRAMLHTKLSGWAHDAQYASEHIVNYKIEEKEASRGTYIFRRPLLSEKLLEYQEWVSSLRADFTAVCEERHPNASQMFRVADALYSYWYSNWFKHVPELDDVLDYDPDAIGVEDEEWQLGDRSSDTGCLQLLADALDRPTCPLEDLPPETARRRQQCRRQLWDDMVQRSPRISVTSYLAYTQKASVHLCLLAWMAASSIGVCQDVPFSMIQSVHDARCYFGRPGDKSCLQSNATDAICVVSRAILLLKCRDFSFFKSIELCLINIRTYTIPWKGSASVGQATRKTVNYKHSLNIATLKYRDFKIEILKPLEISFISVNLLFRFFTAAVYMYLPDCRNLPGKIFLSFQITAIIQILCSEIVYRNAGVPDLSTMVLIDSTLTLFSCLWLNSFCYQMYACVRHLRLPNSLSAAEANSIFRRQVLYVLVACTVVSTTCTALEQTSNYYLIYSRIVVIVAISLSITFNLVCLGLVGYMYLRNRNSMQELKIHSNDKFASKKEIVFMSVKTIIFSGIGVIVRIGFHQAEGIAQFVYWVHIGTMMQGPVLFVFFICNGTTLPALRNRILAWWDPSVIRPGEELCSAAETNLARRRNVERPAAETSL